MNASNPFDLAAQMIALAEQRADKAGLPRVVEAATAKKRLAANMDKLEALLDAKPLAEHVCPYCRGTGWSPLVHASSAGLQGNKCPLCNGTGRVWK